MMQNLTNQWIRDGRCKRPMNHDQKRRDRKHRVLAVAICIIVAVFVGLCLAGCKAKTVVVTQYRDRVQHDTITRVDSVTDTRVIYLKGDTVHDVREVIRYKVLHEKEIVHLIDSIPYEVEVVREVAKPLNGWQRFIQGSGYALWGLLILATVILVITIVIKLKS